MEEKEDKVHNSLDSYENQFRSGNNVQYTYDMRKRQNLSDKEYMLLWTLIFFVFVFGLCALFHDGNFLWLLILWLFGMTG